MKKIISIVLIVFSFCFISYYIDNRIEAERYETSGDKSKTEQNTVMIEENDHKELTYTLVLCVIPGAVFGGCTVYLYQNKRYEKLNESYLKLVNYSQDKKEKPEG